MKRGGWTRTKEEAETGGKEKEKVAVRTDR
jgi:hypothetical protein